MATHFYVRLRSQIGTNLSPFQQKRSLSMHAECKNQKAPKAPQASVTGDTDPKHMPRYRPRCKFCIIPDTHINYPPLKIIAVTAFPAFRLVLSLFLP